MNNNVFRFTYRKLYLLRHPIKLFKEVKDNLRAAWMRCIKGYCYGDIWNFCDWFLATVPKMLAHLEKNHCGHPAYMKEEEWEQVLKELIQHLNNAEEDNPLAERKNPYEEAFIKQFDEPKKESTEIDKQYYTAEIELHKWRQEEIEKAFDLMKKHFFALWD